MANIVRGDFTYQIQGGKEFRRALRLVGDELPVKLKLTYDIVAEKIASNARSNAASLGSVMAKTGMSVQADSTTTMSRINLGGPGFPFAFGAEFGSKRFKQFLPSRGSGKDAGYFLYPAVRDSMKALPKIVDNELDPLWKIAFPD